MSSRDETPNLEVMDIEPGAGELDLRDILRRLERTELEMLALKVRTTTLMESSLDGVILVDKRGRILAINSNAAQMFGYERHELLFEMIETLVPEGDREAHLHHRQRFQSRAEVAADGTIGYHGTAGASQRWFAVPHRHQS